MRKTIVRNRSNVKSRTLAPEVAQYVAALHRAVHALGLYLDAALKGEVSQAEAIVLLHLSTAGNSTINEVHKAFLHKRSTLTSVIDRLEAKGLVRRRIGQADRRNFQLELSERGRTSARRVAESIGDLAAVMRVSAADVQCASIVLERTAGAAAGG